MEASRRHAPAFEDYRPIVMEVRARAAIARLVSGCSPPICPFTAAPDGPLPPPRPGSSFTVSPISSPGASSSMRTVQLLFRASPSRVTGDCPASSVPARSADAWHLQRCRARLSGSHSRAAHRPPDRCRAAGPRRDLPADALLRDWAIGGQARSAVRDGGGARRSFRCRALRRGRHRPASARGVGADAACAVNGHWSSVLDPRSSILAPRRLRHHARAKPDHENSTGPPRNAGW